MDNTNSYMSLLELSDMPAFLVKDRIIIQANLAATSKMIAVGDSICKYLTQDLQAYTDYCGGCLFLHLSIEGIRCPATLTQMDDIQIFTLDRDTQPCLQSLSLAAQQLRTPMNDAFLTAQLVEDPRLAAQITRSLNQMHRCLCNMADAAQYQRQQIQPESTDLGSFFAEIVEKAGTLLEHSEIQLCYSALPQTLIGAVDRQLMERAVLNLIGNGVKFSPKGGKVHIKLARKGNMLHFSVQDSGDGIDSSIQQNLFHRYLRAPGIEDNRHGMGLGLSLVRSAAASHGGTVLVDHPNGIGTRVTITIDLCGSEEDLLHAPVRFPRVDYSGGHDHALLELSEVLPAELYG